jgi:hypothetical protein
MAYQKSIYERDREKKLAYAKQWKIDNKDKADTIRKRFLDKNPNYYKEYNAWYNERRRSIRKGLTRRKSWDWKSGRPAKKPRKTI